MKPIYYERDANTTGTRASFSVSHRALFSLVFLFLSFWFFFPSFFFFFLFFLEGGEKKGDTTITKSFIIKQNNIMGGRIAVDHAVRWRLLSGVSDLCLRRTRCREPADPLDELLELEELLEELLLLLPELELELLPELELLESLSLSEEEDDDDDDDDDDDECLRLRSLRKGG